MSCSKLNTQPKSRPVNSCAPYRNIDCQSLLESTDAPAGWLRTIDKSKKWLKTFVVLYQGHVYFFKNDLSACQKDIFSLYGYDKIERHTEIHKPEGLWIFKIIPAANVTRKSRYFASSSEKELYFWTDHFSREMQMAKIQINTNRIQEDTNCKIINSKIVLSHVQKKIEEPAMECGIRSNSAKGKINNLYMHVTGISEATTSDTIYYFFENKKRSGVGNVYFVDRFNKTESVIFFRSYKEITEFGKKSFLIDNANVTVVEKGFSFNDRVLVQNIHKTTTKDGLKCFVKSQTGQDLQSILFDKIGKAILDFGNVIDFTAVELACAKETLDSSYLEIKPVKFSQKILVTGYKSSSTDDLLFYFDNVRQSGCEDVEDIKKLDDETYLVNFMFSHCIIDVCKREHNLKGKTLGVQIYYQCMDRDDKLDFLTERKAANRKLLNRHAYYNIHSNTTTDVAKKRKRRMSDTGQMSNTPLYCLPLNCEKEWILDDFICKSGNENKKFKKVVVVRLPRCIITQREKAKIMTKAGQPQFHRASFTGRNKVRKKGKRNDINNYSNSEIRENQLSLNTEGNNTLLHTSKVESEANRNPKQDVNNINNYSSSEIRENQSSLNTEGNNTLLHTSKVESEANRNPEQDVNNINNYSCSEIRENQSSLNTEGNNTLLLTSKVESEANRNPKQDVNSLIKSLSNEEENFLVYYQLCVSEAVLSVQRFFSRKVPESTLAAHLESYTNDLKFSRWKCTNDQLDLLFPAVPGNVCSTSFDFSLLYKLIRNTLSLLSSPTRGWGIKPLKGDITDLDDVERIRHNRNVLANNTELKLTNSVFKYLVNDLSQAIKRLSFETVTIGKCRSKKKLILRHKEISENIRKDIEILKDEINTLHRDMFEDKDSIINLQERLKKKADQHKAFYRQKREELQQATDIIKDGSSIPNGITSLQNDDTKVQKASSEISNTCYEQFITVSKSFLKDTLAPYVAILKEHHTFDIPLGAKKREIRDCTTIPGGGWIVSDCNNSELFMNTFSVRVKLSKPMFVTCIDGNVAVSCGKGNKIKFFDIETGKFIKEIQTVETVLGMTNSRERLLVRTGNSGCRYISSGQSDEIIPINGDTLPYIAVWKDNIVLTNWKSHEINCYDTCGVHQWSFTNDNLRSPNGVATDKEGNVFVVGTYSHNILILSKNYKETNKYWFQDVEMRYPIAIDYDQSSDKLIVCNMKGTVKSFDVATAVI